MLKKETLEKLYVLRSRKLYLIRFYEEKINKLNESLEYINKDICLNNGHSFTSWNEKINSFNNVYYERKCDICGKKEISYNICDFCDDYALKLKSSK